MHRPATIAHSQRVQARDAGQFPVEDRGVGASVVFRRKGWPGPIPVLETPDLAALATEA